MSKGLISLLVISSWISLDNEVSGIDKFTTFKVAPRYLGTT